MGCRHMGKCEEAAREIRRKTENAGVVCRFLDLASLDTVEEFSENLRKGKRCNGEPNFPRQ